MKLVIAKLVGETQSSFIPRRQVADNVFIAQEFFHTMQRQEGKQSLMAIKIYLENSYDQVEQDFLEKVLQNVGFDEHLVTLIMRCTTLASLQFMEC